MVPTAPQVSSSLITAAVNGGFRTPTVGLVPKKPKSKYKRNLTRRRRLTELPALRGSWQKRSTSLHARPLNSDFDAPMPSRNPKSSWVTTQMIHSRTSRASLTITNYSLSHLQVQSPNARPTKPMMSQRQSFHQRRRRQRSQSV